MRCSRFSIVCVVSVILGLAGPTTFAFAGLLVKTAAPPSRTTRWAAHVASASRQTEGLAIEEINFTPALSPDAQRWLLIKVEVLLDRAHFSPGAIDGRPGENLHNALAAYAEAQGIPTEGTLTAQIFGALTAADKAPVTRDYTITEYDEKGPFIGSVSETPARLARLKRCGYRGPQQELAEKFHMSEALLRALNPFADFRKAGTSILVLRPGAGDLPTDIARIEVDKSTNQLRVYDNAATLIAVFPATVGSRERPAPSGRSAIKSVKFDPSYVYNHERLTFGNKQKGVLRIPPGPNSPIGSVWIELTKPTYGIHGAPDPEGVGKAAPHGCVRLTNWDAIALGRAVRSGTPVIFLGRTKKR